MEAEQEAEAQRQAEMEAEQEAEAQRQAEMEAEQEAEAQRQAEMKAEQNETNLENLSYDELVEKYNDTRTHDTALGDQYVKYDQQIAEISRDKAYYSSEKEWNSYIDEKISAQNDVSARRNQIQSEMRELEREMDRRKK